MPQRTWTPFVSTPVIRSLSLIKLGWLFRALFGDFHDIYRHNRILYVAWSMRKTSDKDKVPIIAKITENRLNVLLGTHCDGLDQLCTFVIQGNCGMEYFTRLAMMPRRDYIFFASNREDYM